MAIPLPSQSTSPRSVGRATELILPVGLIAGLLVIFIPLPAAIIDVLLVGSITFSVIVLLTTIYIRTPLEFNIFPSLLLAATLGRLVLNIATTRLILTQAEYDGARAAGGVIESFGNVVAGGNVVVGIVIFSIILLIQFVVITKGATRISEVAARFALDGMPGRQVAVDADLNAGIIDKGTAQKQRHEIHQQADFLGAMDGASKFVRGDAVAGLIITIVNIVGGLVIGIFQLGFPPFEAANLFTRLTIGDGLVSQLPALLIALAAGLLVTRSSASTNLPLELVGQLFSRPKALVVAAVFLSLLLLTNLPRMPLILLAMMCVVFSLILTRSKNKEPSHESNETAKDEKPNIENLLAVDPLEIEIGVGLIRLADRSRGGDLLERIHHVRENVALQLGLVMPKVRVHDKVQLKANEYQIKISEVVVASGTIHSSTALATALMESIYNHAADLLTRDATKFLIDRLRQTHPVIVEELIPNKISLAEIQQTLQLLLRERLPIRQIGLILEALGDGRSFEDNPIRLTEYVRQRMARTITSRYRDETGEMQVMQLEATFEDSIREAMHYTQCGLSVNIAPSIAEELLDQVEVALDNPDNHQPILLVPTDIRPAVHQLTTSRLPQLIVLGFGEITHDTQIHTVAMLGEAAMSIG